MGWKSKELSPDKIEVIVNLKSNGHRISEISRMLSIPESTCRSVIKTYNERKSLKKLVVLDGQEKCLLVVKPDWSAWWKKNVEKFWGIYIVVTEFNIGNGDHSVSETTVQRYLHKNRFYRRIVKKRMAEWKKLTEKSDCHGAYRKEDGL